MQRTLSHALAATSALAFAGAGCGGGGSPPSSRDAATPSSTQGPFRLDKELDGTVYMSAGPLREGLIIPDLYKWSSVAADPVRLTDGGVLSANFSARGRVVVASVSQAIRSEVVRLNPTRLNRLPRPPIATASGVALGPGGRLAYDAYREHRGGAETVVYTATLGGGPRRVVHRGGVDEVQWTPDARLLVHFKARGRMRLAVYRGLRRERTVVVPPNSYRVHVSSRGQIVVGAQDGFLLLSGDGHKWRRRRVPWRVLCWHPGGRSMLAVDDENSRIALLSPQGNAKVVGKVAPETALGRCEWEPQRM